MDMENMNTQYRICTRCIMDTTDPEIVFDEHGVCNHCYSYDRQASGYAVVDDAEREQRLQRIVEKIRRDGRRKSYDCVIGVSGGVDSTFVAYKVKEYGLRPLAVHLDNGWDSELAVKNIERVLKRLKIDLYTRVLDWEEFKDLQVAFLKSSTPDSEIPSDHAIWATLGDMAEKIGVKYIVTGFNVRTETHLPRSWSQGHFDWRYIKSVHAQFGKIRISTFPHENFFAYYRRLFTLKRVPILNYIKFSKQDALKILEKELDWQYYGGKHYESIYTRFYQGYLLPVKFGYDKRRSHLSSLICSGEITREQALEELMLPTYSPALQEEDREYVVKKLGLTEESFSAIMGLPPKSYLDYPSYGQFVYSPAVRKLVVAIRKTMGRL